MKKFLLSLVSMLMMLGGTAFADNYEKVTATADITDGEYLIVYETGNLAFNGALETLDAVSNTVSVKIADGKIASSETIDAATFTINVKEGSLKSASGKYIGQTSDANGLKSSDTFLENTITIDDDGNVNIVSGGAFLRYNASANQNRFRYFKSSSYTSQKAIQLYKKVGGGTDVEDTRITTTVTLSEDNTTTGEVGTTIALPTAMVKSGDATVDGASIVWTSNNENVAKIEGSNISLLAAGTTIIKATYAGDETYKESSKSYTLTVTAAPYTSIAAMLEAITATQTTSTYQFENLLVTFVRGSNTYVSDGSNGFLFYGSNLGLEVGKVYSGTATGQLYTYNGLPEMSLKANGLDVTPLSEGNEISWPSVEPADLEGYVNIPVAIKNAVFVGASYKNLTFKKGDTEFAVYNQWAIDITALEVDQAYDLVGVGAVYAKGETTTYQLYLNSFDEYTAPTTYAINIAETENGTVVAGKSTAEAGEAVTLTITPNDGYQLDELSVKAGDENVAVEENTFVMPEADVTVTVTFKKVPALVSGTVYWIQDVSTGQFISQGDNWSTRAVAQDVGGLGFEAVYVSDGVYKLNNIMWNKVNNVTIGLGVDAYVDQTPAEWTLTASGDGYLLSNGGNYLANNGSENAYKEKGLNKVTDAAETTVWKFLTRDEYDVAIQAYKDGKAATYATNLGYTASTVADLEAILATDYIGKDYTTSITNPTLGSSWDGWTHGTVSQRGEGAGIGSGCAEFWNGCGYATQTVSDLPNGLYKVTFVGTYRPKAKDAALKCASEFASSPAFVYANDAKVEFLHWIDVTANADGRSGITVGNGYQNTMYTYVTDGTLALGVVGDGWTDGYSWNPFGQFTLTYYSDQVEDADITALVATIPASGTIPTAVSTNLASLQSTLESAKTIAAYNNLTAAITAANGIVAPYAAYKVAAEDASIAGIADATISEQDAAVEEATDAVGVEACTSALRTAIAGITSFAITDYTIKNPTAQTKDNWEGTEFGDASNNVCEYWNKSGADFHQTIASLPAGNYRLTVVALQRTGMTGTVYAGEKKTVIAETIASVSSRTTASEWFSAGNGVNTVYFTLADAADVTIGLTADATTGDHWTVWQSFKLETFDESVAASYLKPGYEEALAAAQAYQSQDMFDLDKTALNTAISDNTVDPATATIAGYETAIANLNAATAAAATAVANYTRYNNIVAAIGENENVDLTSFVVNADFEENSLNGWTSADGGNVANNGNFNSTYFVERWQNNVALGSGSLTHDAIVLPAGVYKITADAQNIEQYNNAAAGKGLFLCANAEATEIGAKGNYDIYVKLADKDALTIKFRLDNCTGNWVSYDNVTLTYVAADFPELTVVEGKMNATVAAAQTTANEVFTQKQTGVYYKNLLTAIAVAQASKDAYTAAAAALTKANSILNSTNVYTAAARTTFSEAIATAQAAYDDGSMEDATANGLNAALNVAAWGATPAPHGSDYVGSAWTGTNIDYNFWSTEGDAEGASGMSTPFVQYWVADAEKLADNNITATLTGLDNGLYSVTAFVRVVNTKEGDDAGYDGITLAVNDGTPVAFADATEYTDGYAKEITAEGLVKDGNLAIKFAVESTNASWLAFKDVNYTKVRDLTEEEKAVAPTAIALYNGEDEVTEPIALNAATTTVTLTPNYTPADASEGYITWTSSDEAVATVADGVVTAVAPGTATITVTSTLDATVSATADVTVTFPESTVPENYYANDGATRTIYTLGDNLFKNGSFEYPNAVATWKTVGYTTDAVAGAYITTNGTGVGSEKTLRKSIAVEVGKTYYFSVYTSGKAPDSQNFQYNALFKMSDATTESGSIKQFEWSQGAGQTTSEWSKTECIFTAETPYVGVRMGWNSSTSFDEFVLAEVTNTETIGNVQYALDAIPTANIGPGAFQYSQDAIDAANALVQGTATVAEVEVAYEALTTLNAPAEGKTYNVVNITSGYAYSGNALTFKSAKDADLAGNTTNMAWSEKPGSIYPQNVTFTAVDGVKNGYTMSYTRADGNTVYVSTGKTSGLGANAQQIRPTTDASKALTVQVQSAAEGKWYLLNTEDKHSIGASNDNGFYTNDGSNKDVCIQEAVENEVALKIEAKNQYATLIVPFDAEVPAGVKAYSASAVAGNKLTLTEATELKANTPYVLYAAEGVDTQLAGLGSAYTDATYTDVAGLLTGVYAETEAPKDSYVLQHYTDEAKNIDLVAFLHVDTDKFTPKVGANRAYLTVPNGGSVKAYFLGEDTDGIRNVEGETGSDAIYNLSGQRVSKAQRGLYIVNGKRVLVK